jgi:hypothetical protein
MSKIIPYPEDRGSNIFRNVGNFARLHGVTTHKLESSSSHSAQTNVDGDNCVKNVASDKRYGLVYME